MQPIILKLTAVALAMGVSTPIATAAEQSPAEGKLDLREIAARLPGDYDNEPQRFFLEGMKRGAAAPARRHVTVRQETAATTTPGPAPSVTLKVEERDGDERAPVTRRSSWTLSIDPATNLVRMQVTAAAASSGAATCTVGWQRRAAVFVGTPDAACRNLAEAPGTLWLADGEIWDERPGTTEPARLMKAQPYDCFVALRLDNGQPQAFMGLQVHDRGGTAEVNTRDTPARRFTLLLRRGLWPSNSGNNFVELLTLYLHEAGRTNVVGSGWATPESGRVGFGIGDELPGGQLASARCKRASLPGGA